jgi:glycosyltransferase involved in cell wall biosynthesis
VKNSLLLISGIYPPDTGGPASFTEDFAHWLSQNNEKVSVVTYTDGPSQTKYFDSIKITYVHRYENLPKRYICFAWSILKNYDSTVRVLTVGAFLETMLASLVRNLRYTTKIPGDIVWERARNNSITSLDILEFQTIKLSWKYFLFRKLFSYSVKSASLVLVPSTQLETLALTWGARPAQTQLVYNSVQVSELPISIESPTYDFVTVSRLVPWKGIDHVIQNVCTQGYRLLVVGDGPQRIALERLASNFPGLVDFAGEIAANDVGLMLKKAKNIKMYSIMKITKMKKPVFFLKI